MYAVEFEGITKEFPGIIANNDISFRVKKGTVHALIGENGAGKSTLMSILFGLYEPTRGRIKINGEYVNIKNPNMANDMGIGMVHQHFKLVGIYSNLENIILGSEFVKSKLFLNRKLSIKKIKSIQKNFNLNFKLNELTKNSSVAVQQKVEIMKMLYRDNEILIFDEPTAVLTDEEIKGLLNTIKVFKEQGKTVILISHKLKEIKEVADTATVLRHGKVTMNCDVKTTSIEEIAAAMVGGNVVEAKNTNHDFNRDGLIFEIKNGNLNSKQKNLSDINIKVHKGEIVAIAGVEGNGQEEIEKIINGNLKLSSGKIYLTKIFDNFLIPVSHESFKLQKDEFFKKITIDSLNLLSKKLNKNYHNFKLLPKFSKENGYYYIPSIEFDITKLGVKKRSQLDFSYVPSDRHKHGLILDFNIKMNFVLRRLWDKTYNFLTIFKQKNIQNKVDQVLENFDVRGARNGISMARSLSGGNQQKFIVGREMLNPHDFLLIMQPTRGLDVGAIKNIHEKLLKEKAKGKGILLISYELDEILSIADTILILSKGRILKTAKITEITRKEIGVYMTDVSDSDLGDKNA